MALQVNKSMVHSTNPLSTMRDAHDLVARVTSPVREIRISHPSTRYGYPNDAVSLHALNPAWGKIDDNTNFTSTTSSFSTRAPSLPTPIMGRRQQAIASPNSKLAIRYSENLLCIQHRVVIELERLRQDSRTPLRDPKITTSSN